jgi:tungstate transport system ATP-binding protein
MGLRFRGLPREAVKVRVARWLSRLEIEHLAARSARKISGGEAQRVSLARAFVLEPELLLLDEPFSGLDNATRRRLLGDLRAILLETRTTAIFITHNLNEAIRIASHLAVFLEGRVCQVGTVTEVLDRPATPQIAALLGTVGAAQMTSG